MIYCRCGERSQILLRKCDITSADGRKFFLFILMDCSVGVKIILFKVEIYYPTATDGRNHHLSIYRSIHLSIPELHVYAHTNANQVNTSSYEYINHIVLFCKITCIYQVKNNVEQIFFHEKYTAMIIGESGRF